MIKLIDLLKEVSNKDILVYHAGPVKLKVADIEFDRAALGFHVGTLDQAKYVLNKTKRGFGGVISKFKVLGSTDNVYIEQISRDMPWEHADLLILDLLAEGLINRNTAIQFADDWQINEDDFYEGKFYRYIDKASRMFDRNYTSSDDVGANLSSEYYENTDKLSQIREVLVREYAIGAIIYKNDVESSTPNATSVCILDKSLIQDVV